MKFTKEQYQKIIDAWDLEDTYAEATQAVVDVISVFTSRLQDEALAIANPVTREWAHEKFVEKEKKYLWTNKNIERIGLCEEDGVILPKLGHWQKLTESEIKAWGYNPEMFDKEEVE